MVADGEPRSVAGFGRCVSAPTNSWMLTSSFTAAAAWECSVGSGSGRSPGCIRAVDCVVAWTGSRSSKRRSSVWLVPCSVCESSNNKPHSYRTLLTSTDASATPTGIRQVREQHRDTERGLIPMWAACPWMARRTGRRSSCQRFVRERHSSPRDCTSRISAHPPTYRLQCDAINSTRSAN